jgi:hypothetical protein
MGWGRMLLLGNVGQQLDIGDLQHELGRITSHLEAGSQFDRQTADALKRLARENAELKLYLAALIRLLAGKGVVTSAELAAIVDAIDRSDGSADGGYTGPLRGPG